MAHTRAMVRVIALARTAQPKVLEALRMIIVGASAAALIAAGQALPF